MRICLAGGALFLSLLDAVYPASHCNRFDPNQSIRASVVAFPSSPALPCAKHPHRPSDQGLQHGRLLWARSTDILLSILGPMGCTRAR